MQKKLITFSFAVLLLLPGFATAQSSEDVPEEPIVEEEILEEIPFDATTEEPLLEEELSEPASQEAAPPTESSSELVRARVLEVTLQTPVESDWGLGQQLKIRIENGERKGETVEVTHGGQSYLIKDRQLVKQGEQVVVLIQDGDPNAPYVIVDRYRLPQVIVLLLIFFAVVFVISRRRGLTSLLGLIVSITILVLWVLPALAKGTSPLLVAFTAGLAILTVSLLIAHGFNKRSLTALGSAVFTFGLAIGLSVLAVSLAKLTGFGTEDAAGLQFSSLGGLDFRGLLLAGILIGTLGVLDDVTVSQTVTITELAQANPDFTSRDLFQRGLRIGREHIASLVNTLALAYAGTALPLLLFISSDTDQPLWLTANSEFIAEEVVRTIVGSLALVLAVPIATVLAARVFGKKH